MSVHRVAPAEGPRPERRGPSVKQPSTFSLPEWIVGSLTTARRIAQTRAELAYEEWRRAPGDGGAEAYRAAQDRADAIQDDLVRLNRLISAG